MFSSSLGFRLLPGEKQPSYSLSSLEFYCFIKDLKQLGLLLRSLYANCRKPRPLRDFLLVCLADRGTILLNLQIMQLGRNYCSRLKKLVTRDLRRVYQNSTC